MRSITEQQDEVFSWLVKGFFFVVKAGFICALLLTAVLVISQSAVAPVSSRLLGMYAVEYSAAKLKPYRSFFPKPYMIDLEQDKR